MEEMYGPITVYIVSILISMSTQIWKALSNSEGAKAMAQSFIVSLVWTIPFHILVTLITWRDAGFEADWLDYAWTAFTAVAYAFLGWFTAIGMYTATTKTVEYVKARNGQ